MALESTFQRNLIRELRILFPEAIVLKNDPNYLQGFPDITLLFETGMWAVLETKRSQFADRQANQPYYINRLCRASFAAFIYPENKEEIIDELRKAHRSYRVSCVSGA
jgi:hypothetical protein